MKPMPAFLFVLLAAGASPATAAAPLLRETRSVIVHASPDRVWARIGRFGDLASWHPDVAKSVIASGSDDHAGAQRSLELKGGGHATDTLLGYDARHHRYRYAMHGGTLPVADFSATLGVKAAGRNRSKVSWVASFHRRDPGGDAAATRAVAGFLDDGLAALRADWPGR